MRCLPTLPTDLTKARTQDLINYLDVKLREQEEVYFSWQEDLQDEDHYVPPPTFEYSEKLSDITTELLRRADND